ncbi:lysine transporter LysE [Terasakiispira papahanaumokuakeensis]|uniref:Lysine transporter LysE n=1 Tax=Terasakiispira papahanaumokuakeensis TaxID=197479 RepID=A0A1E2VAM9_9GAMM|nr:LysE family transporter [Terasakiispira papahanaumokuakeensis]ODC04068.1 lysine transporter LysE [Terasakiispira papahanaumokuakeensis]
MTGYWSEFSSLALIHLMAVLMPGPDFAITVRQSLRYGIRVGILTALGIGLGLSVHVAYTLVGVSALMKSWPWLMTAAELLGAGYLIFLGGRLLVSRAASINPLAAEAADLSSSTIPPPSWRQALMIGVMTNATNPKATLFFLAIFTTIVSPSTPFMIQLGYGAWMCSINALWFMCVAIFFAQAKVRQYFLKMGHWLERIVGLLLIGFAVRLVTAVA